MPTARDGEKSGEKIMRAILWVLTNRFLSFPSFFIGAQAIIIAVASTLGVVQFDGAAESVPKWLFVIMVAVPAGVMIRFRKMMPLLAVETFRYVAIFWLLKMFYVVISS